jgi:hypothetical protein
MAEFLQGKLQKLLANYFPPDTLVRLHDYFPSNPVTRQLNPPNLWLMRTSVQVTSSVRLVSRGFYVSNVPGGFMDILVALKQEQAKLQSQLKGIEGAIAALNGSHHSASRASITSHNGTGRKRVMSAAARAKISKATKERWAKYRAEKARKAK